MADLCVNGVKSSDANTKLYHLSYTMDKCCLVGDHFTVVMVMMLRDFGPSNT
jgi:hypothetical protein